MRNLKKNAVRNHIRQMTSLRICYIVCVMLLALQSHSEAAEFTVNTTADTADASPGDGACADASGNCSLRAALDETNADTTRFPNDVVNIPAGHYRLSLGALEITDDVSLIGDGPDVTIIDADNNSGVIRVGNILYDHSLSTDPVATATFLNDFPNCLVSEGCYGKPLVIVHDGTDAQNSAHISDPINSIVFNFLLTAGEITAVSGNSGRGVLTVSATRDIGRRQCSSDLPDCQADGYFPAEDWLETRVESTLLGDDLFRNTLSTCPPGENFDPINFTCGPNFHTDSGALQSVAISESTMQSGATDGRITVEFTPSVAVGLLKIFEVRLEYLKDILVNINDLTIQNGNNSGGLRNEGGFVQLSHVRVRDSGGSGSSVSFLGGGIINSNGTITFTDSSVSGNTASRGGGIFNGSLGTITLERSTVDSNTVSQLGGGIANSGRLNLTNTTVSGNDAGIGGGGIQNTGIANISFSTLTQNAAHTRGTRFSNAVGGGILNSLNGQVNISNSILAQNSDNRSAFADLSGPDCFSLVPFRFTSFRGNLVGVLSDNCDMRDTIFGAPPNFDMFGTPSSPLDPQVDPLANNGGPTQTHALQSDSPAVDEGTGVTSSPLSDCPATDQRGISRPANGNSDGSADCDIGAYELSLAVEPGLELTGVSPSTLTAGASTQLALSGTGFVAGASVHVCRDGGVSTDQVHFLDSGRLRVDVTVAPDRPAGSCDVRVKTPDGSRSTLRSSIIVNEAEATEPLELMSVSPTTLSPGTSVGLRLKGSGFVPGTSVGVCRDGGVSTDQVHFLDSGRLRVDVTVAPDRPAGSCDVRVKTPDGSRSTLRSSIIVNEAEATEPLELMSVSPTTLSPGTSVGLRLKGSGFVPGTSVGVCRDGGVSTDRFHFVDSSRLRVDVTVAPDRPAGSCGVRVKNPDGSHSTLRSSINVLK